MRGYWRSWLVIAAAMYAGWTLAVPAGADEPAPAPAEAASTAEDEAAATTAAEPEATGEDPQGAEDARATEWLRGSFDAGFDGVWADGGSDINTDQTLRFQIDPPDMPRLHIRGSIWLDEDWDTDSYYRAALRDYSDNTHSGVRANLLYLYADIDDVWGDSVLRIGRQRILESPLYNRIDGLYFKQRVNNWEWYVFGGARGSVYFDTHDDLSIGGGVAVQAAPSTRIAVDAFYGDEDRDKEVRVHPLYRLAGLKFPRDLDEKQDNNYVSFSLWQAITANMSFHGRFGLQDGEPDDLILSLNGVIPQWDVAYQAAYRGQLQENGDQINDLTAYYRILGPYERYDNFLLAAHKALNEVFTLSLEGEFNNSHASGDDVQANRDYQRYAVILSADELLPTIDATVALEYWDVIEGEGTWALTGEVSKTWNKLKLTVGADYERFEDRYIEYRSWMWLAQDLRTRLIPGTFRGYDPLVYVFDTYVVDTHYDIYSFYAGVKYALAADQDVKMKVTYEEDDSSESPYWRVEAGYSLRF